eukprot:CAMPEP_0175223760 /NCGR_PEP_ID=MMETSP0093-20121207/21499_1 /TAXON_ID=311494 /ORGANISM="Alexandrium monilatum, Strain CCMP3105" /LENGTH=562 /DNA_ID=CAMNT_0016517375 /DNA_START=75 /DNA_END=1762 /DNA_ORIENTATION=+
MTAKVAAFIPLHFALAMEGAALRPLALAELSRVQRAEATCAAHARGISEGALGDAAEEASLSQLAQVAQRFDRMQTTGKTAAGNLTAVERWQQHFVDAVADEATLACRIGSIDGCKCSDGTSGTYCCMDGKMINSGSGGGSPVAGTVWRWFRRDGAEWHCTEANECPHYEVTTYQPGADPPFESPTRGADIFFASEDATCNTPRVLFIHGGAWNSGAPNEIGYFTTGSRLARDAGAVVMAIDYPLARTCFRQAEGGCFDTERANQTIMRDWAVSALEYLAGHVPNIPGTKIPGEGCSNEAPLIIGGGLVALSTLLSIAPGGSVSLRGKKFQPAGAFLWSGFYDLQCMSPSYVQSSYAGFPKFGGKPSTAKGWWHVGATDSGSDGVSGSSWAATPSDYAWWSCRLLALHYSGSSEATEDPYFSTTKATPAMLQGLPPIILSVDGSYGLVGEAHVVAQNAAAADDRNEVYLDVYPGLMHDFQMYSEGCGAGMSMWQGQMAWRRTAAFIKAVASTKAGPPHVPHAPCHDKMPRGNAVTTYHLEKPLPKAGVPGEQWGAYPDGTFC